MDGVQKKTNELTFSEALERTKFGRFNVFLIILGGIVLANVVLEIGAIGFILPLAECDLHLTDEDKGMLSAIAFAGVILSSHLWGFLADTRGRRAVIMPTLLISSVMTFLSSFSDRFWVLLFFRFANGFFASGASATIFAYVGEFHVEHRRSRALLTSSFTLSVSAIIWPFIAWGVINETWSLPLPFLGITYKPWRLFMVIFGAPGFLCGIILYLLPESPQFLMSVGKELEAIDVLKKIHRWNVPGEKELEIEGLIPDKDITVRDLTEFKGTNPVTKFLNLMWDQTVPLFKSGFIQCTIVICLIQFLYHVAIHGFFVWFPYIVDTVVGLMGHHRGAGNGTYICELIYEKETDAYNAEGETQCNQKLEVPTYIYTVIMEILCTAGYGLILIIVNKVRKVHILLAIFVGCGVCGIITAYVSNASVAIWLYAFMLIGSNAFHVLAGVVVELYPTHLRGMALSISLLISRIGGVVGGNFIGLLLTHDCELTFSISGGLLVFCGLLTFLIPKQLTSTKDAAATLEL